MKKIAIVTTHPVQYNAPFFKLLAQSEVVTPKVFYTWGETVLQSKYDPDFRKSIQWDIPLLEGYEHEFIPNKAKARGSHHFRGIDNPKIIEKIEAWQPDAILVYGWNFRSHLKLLRYFKNKIPVWFRGDSTLLDKQKFPNGLFRRIFLTWVYRHVDLAFYTGTNNKHYFLHHGLKESQLVRAVHAVDNKRFFAPNEKKDVDLKGFRQSINIPQNGIVFLFAGKLSPKKGLDTLIKAFRHFSMKDSFLVIVGNGPLEKDLKKMCEGEKNILFSDFINQAQMPVVYANCDVFILPSTGPGETWGLSVNEAMAAGKPVIVSNKCGSAPDLVENGKNGYVFEAGNSCDLADKMKQISCSKEKLAQFGGHSKMMINDFTFSEFITAIENAITTIG